MYFLNNTVKKNLSQKESLALEILHQLQYPELLHPPKTNMSKGVMFAGK